jgi:dihydroorotase
LIRDVESCYLSSSLAVDLAKKYDSDLHVFHLTTEKEMNLFTSGAIDGKKITAEVCVHHMYFNETFYAELVIKLNATLQLKKNPTGWLSSMHCMKEKLILLQQTMRLILGMKK